MPTTSSRTTGTARAIARRSPHLYSLLLAAAVGGASGLTAGTASAQTFTDATVDAGIVGDNSSWGHAWFDFDNDGDADLISHAHLQDVLPSITQLWRNNGDGTFSDITTDSGFTNYTGDTHGVVTGDFDDDGFVDFYVLNGTLKIKETEYNQLWRNNGDGSFTKITEARPPEDPLIGYSARGRGAYAFDYNRDGKLDIFATSFYRGGSQDSGNLLLENQGALMFEDVGPARGIDRKAIVNRPAAWSDYNGDRIVDVFFGTDCGLSAGQADGSFVDVTASAGIAAGTQCASGAWGDYDGDGDQDLYVSYGFDQSRLEDILYRNNGDGTFTNVTTAAGISNAVLSRGASWGDVDNDGDLDLYVVNFQNVTVANKLFSNNGDGTFTDIAADAGVTAQVEGGGSAGTLVDYNNDGSLDIFVSNGEANEVGPYVLLKNDGNDNHWLKARLIGRTSNPDGLMTWMRAETPTVKVERLHTGPQSFLSQSTLPVHFGLADQTRIDRLSIQWPSGVKQQFRNLAVDQTLTLVESRPIWSDSPAFSAPGFYIWQNANGSVWKLVWLSDGTARKFTGRITLTPGATFTNVVRSRHEGDETVTSTSTTVTFEATESGVFDGLDLTVTGTRPQLTFDLQINDVREPGAVFIGKYTIKPATLPVALGR